MDMDINKNQSPNLWQPKETLVYNLLALEVLMRSIRIVMTGVFFASGSWLIRIKGESTALSHR
jgi:hypothetical protein